MQSYIHFGYGFHGALLTDAEYDRIMRNYISINQGNVGIEFRAFTDDHDGRTWGTIVLKDFGEARVYGKLEEDLTKVMDRLGVMSDGDRIEIRAVLDAFGLLHLEDSVRLLVYMDNY